MLMTERDLVNEEFLCTAIARPGEGGLSVRAYCRQEPLSECGFIARRRTLAERDDQMAGTDIMIGAREQIVLQNRSIIHTLEP